MARIYVCIPKILNDEIYIPLTYKKHFKMLSITLNPHSLPKNRHLDIRLFKNNTVSIISNVLVLLILSILKYKVVIYNYTFIHIYKRRGVSNMK